MSVETQTPIQKAVDELIDLKLDLETLLGDGWKERSLYPNIETAFTQDELQAVTERRKVTEEIATTPVELYAAKLDKVFLENGGTYSASVAEIDGQQRAVVLGEVGGDLFYLTTQLGEVKPDPDRDNGTIGIIGVDRFAVISKDGGVMRVDRMLKGNDSETDIVFLDPQGRKSRANFETDQFGNGGGVVTQLPYDTRGVGTVFHEIGHAVRAKFIGQNPDMDASDNIALKEYGKASKTGSPLDPSNRLSSYQSRQIKANDERGAWAIGASILREANKTVGINTGSVDSVREMLGRAEEALSTYDAVPYTLVNQPEGEMIPSFSQSARGDAREVQHKIEVSGASYSDVPSFDQDTGENIANNPAKISSILDETGSPDDK